MIDEAVAEIEAMQTHSSSAVAVTAAEALRELLGREYATVEEYRRALERNSDALRRANTSHASLFTTQREIVDRVTADDHDSVAAAKATTADAVDAVVEEVERAKHEAAREAVTEARPRHVGRKAARTLSAIDRVEPTLITDGAAGHYLDDCDRVVVGMDCIVDDVLYNRVGTFPIAATAAELAVPVSVLGSSAKLIDDGFAFENEFRPASEVMLEPAEGFDVGNPAYDATPTHLLDNVVTDEGVHKLE
ncbi:initiation factor 2B [Halobacteriales archaeon QS_8_69_73]|nr:MAG: initiation factor 2B [Halobacteriales archaeon QS_8_69_73]